MQIKEIYSKIIEHQIIGIMLHEQASKMLDFLGFRGLKRWQEYQYISESMSMRSTNRYVINHHNIMVMEGKPTDPELIPMSWYNYTRYDVDTRTKQSALKDFFDKLKSWEHETKKLYSSLYKECCNEGHIADAVKIKSLIEDVDKELKCVDRKYLEYKSVEFDLSYIMYQQCEIHDKYKNKEKEIGIDIN